MTPLQINEHNEQALLGYAYTDPQVIDRATQAGVTAEAFIKPEHHHQWRFLCELRLRGMGTDSGTVIQEAVAAGRISALGGIPHIFQCADLGSASPGGAGPCIDRILDVHAKRQAYKLLKGAVESLEGGGGDVGEVRETVERVAGICAGNATVQRTLADVGAEIETNLREIEEGKELTGAISWGLPKLDRFIRPLKRNEYTLICARPSRGKTSMLTHLTGYNFTKGKRVVFFNLEDDDTDIVKKMASQMAGVCLDSWADLTNEDRARFRRFKDKIVASKNILIFDRDRTLEAIQSRCRLLVNSFKPELVVIDYLGCIRMPGKSIYESVSTVSKAMPGLRKTLGCPLVAGQQLKRLEVESGEPTLGDLRDSGQLEEDATRVVLLHWKESQYLDQELRPYKIMQPKYRFGPTTAVSGINFHAPTTRWMEAN
jgi:replicative DNA helicase